jgi:calnexin
MPDVAAGLAAAFFTLIGMLAALFGLMGSSKPVVCSSVSSPDLADVKGQEDKDQGRRR